MGSIQLAENTRPTTAAYSLCDEVVDTVYWRRFCKSVFISQVVDGIIAHMMQACFYRLGDSAARRAPATRPPTCQSSTSPANRCLATAQQPASLDENASASAATSWHRLSARPTASSI